MSGLFKIMPIYLLLFGAYMIFSFLNTYFWLSGIKFGSYTLPLNKIPILDLFFSVPLVFKTHWGFTVGAWVLNAPGYFFATLIVGWAYKISVDNYGVLYPAFIIGQIAPLITSMFFLYFRIGELPNMQEWLALVLIFIASFILINSR